MASKDANPGRMSSPVLDLSHVEIEVPDYEEIKQQRLGRNRQAMEAADKRLTKEIFPQTDKSSLQTRSAIFLQRMWRGVMGRKRYVELLYEQYEKEYQESQEKIAEQMKEGQLLVDNKDLERCLQDGHTIRKNRTRQYISHVITIQRAWRQYHRNKRKRSTDIDETPDPSQASICISSGSHRNNGNDHCEDKQISGCPIIPTIVINDNKDNNNSNNNNVTIDSSNIKTSSNQNLPSNTTLANDVTHKITSNHSENNSNTTNSSTGTAPIFNLATRGDPKEDDVDHNDPHDLQDLQDPRPDVDSDHEDEPSETESTIASHAMTDLTPEENQGAGANNVFPTSASSDSLGADELPPFTGRVEEQRSSIASSTSSSVAATTGVGGSLLDASKVLSGLERNRLSPSRYSVDVECDSVASDYSELGGTLKDIEKDVCYLDREALTIGLGVGEGEVFSLEQLGLRRRSSDLVFTNTPADKQENESEADFQRRLRKVSILSLAQEFALLKKVDSQACPISFHLTNKSKPLRHSATPSPVSSRGHSCERTRRTVSRSPHRTINPNKSDNPDSQNLSNPTATMQQRQQPPPPPPPPPSSSSSMTTTSSTSSSQNPKAANPSVADLPINEARRRNSGSGSDDLPVNMRPERRILMQQQQHQEAISSPQQQSSVQTSSSSSSQRNNNNIEGDGDFDVYNIENTMPPNLDWKTLQQQMEKKESEGKTRLQACKNEREEIRRRLAMTDDDKERDDDNDDDDDTSSNLTGSMLSNPRLQTSLEGAQNMQICFIPDDILDDDDDDDDITIGSHVINTVREDRTGCDDVISTSEDDTLSTENESNQPTSASTTVATALSNRRPDPERIASRQSQLQTEATLALAQASTMARMQLEVERQTKKKSPIADMVGIPTLGNGRKLRLSRSKLTDMNVAQLQVLVNDLHSQIELLNEDLVHLLIERDDLHMEQDSMLVDIEDLTSHCPDPRTTNNNKTSHNNNRPGHRKDVRRH